MHCKGSVVPEENRFNIDYIARPQLDLASQDFKSSKGSVYQREAICSGVEDHLILSVQGESGECWARDAQRTHVAVAV